MHVADRVVLSRKRTAAAFPLPAFDRCVRYAIQECGETDDAWMREEHPEHKRNSERTPFPRREWGQVGYMILSGATQRVDWGKYQTQIHGHVQEPRSTLFGGVVMQLGLALIYERNWSWSQSHLHTAFVNWVYLCRLEGWDPDELIDETCKAFEAKHAVREAANDGQ